MNLVGSNSVDDRYYQTPHFDTNLSVVDLDSKSQECEKTKRSAAIISKTFYLGGIWCTFLDLLV